LPLPDTQFQPPVAQMIPEPCQATLPGSSGLRPDLNAPLFLVQQSVARLIPHRYDGIIRKLADIQDYLL
ncbi:MAG: hypothetical protein LH647_08210, partial [Leptolyngbyaceae cyanobacterium CAN_BIN12]|nr:hypothetical protein [Leptolyngbyaceae cyanobacterium CAN_BIN12]